MSSLFQLRVQCSLKQSLPIIECLAPHSTFENLNQVLSSITEIHEDQVKVLSGFPPKQILGDRSSKLLDIGVKNGEVLIVEKRADHDLPQYTAVTPSKSEEPIMSNPVSPASVPEAVDKTALNTVTVSTVPETKASVPLETAAAAAADSQTCSPSTNNNRASSLLEQSACSNSNKETPAKSTSPPTKAIKRTFDEVQNEESLDRGVYLQPGQPLGLLQKKEVASDNSCLFASMVYVLTGKMDAGRVQELRRLVSASVLTETTLIPEYVLDRPRLEYSQWILRDQSWGGEIELALLSKHYGLEIAAVDAKTARINRFGESEQYKVRVFLLYDGIHYDPLHMESPTAEGHFYTSFSTSMDAVLVQAAEIAGQLHQCGHFTDTDKFTLQCGQCGHKMRGETEALQHARETGHTAFEEVKNSNGTSGSS